jgi:hypothetical protein
VGSPESSVRCSSKTDFASVLRASSFSFVCEDEFSIWVVSPSGSCLALELQVSALRSVPGETLTLTNFHSLLDAVKSPLPCRNV